LSEVGNAEGFIGDWGIYVKNLELSEGSQAGGFGEEREDISVFFENEALEGRHALQEVSVDTGHTGVGDDERREGGERGPFVGEREVTSA
jgi:hypothetical protein